MTSTVRILSGSYRKQPVVNKTFKLVKGYQTGAKGGYITVKNEGQFNIDIEDVRVLVDDISKVEFTYGENDAANDEPVIEQKETETEAMDRIASRFAVLDEMSRACIAGDIRAMIVTGPAGIGKSHGVTQQMEKASMFDKISGKRPRFEIVKGAMSGIGLFAKLYKYSDKKNVLVFDDCDIWDDQDAVNVLKGALDSGKTRRISWNKDSRLLRDEGVPNTFDFHGSIIFITNKTFDAKKASKMQPHLDALQSRSHFLDLTVDTERDKMLRIKQVHRDADGGLFADYDFTQEQTDEVMSFIWDNHSKLREVSLRMCLKIADLVKISGNWRELAKATCMKRG
jgi:SpoU rRNA methylase family enzyme